MKSTYLYQIATVSCCIGLMAWATGSSTDDNLLTGFNHSNFFSSQINRSIMVDSISSSIAADTHNILGPFLLYGIVLSDFLFPGYGAGKGWGFGMDHYMFSPTGNCVSTNRTDDSSHTTTTDYSFACQNVTGTYQVQSAPSGPIAQLAIAGNLAFTGTNGDSSSTSATYSINKSASNTVTINKRYDDITKTDAVKNERKGSTSYVFIPDSNSMPWGGGTIRLTGSYDNINNGNNEGLVTVTSSGLHRSLCGLDHGSITYENATDIFIMTFAACGKAALTDNGKQVLLLPGSIGLPDSTDFSRQANNNH